MQPTSPGAPSFIEEARRRQIVRATIGALAQRGLIETSLAEIARDAGVSRGVISYHFDGKEELLEEVLRTLLTESTRFVRERVRAASGVRAKLASYVVANFDFMRARRENYVAWFDLWGRFGSPPAKRRFDRTVYEPCRRYVRAILREGQRSGELRAFPLAEGTALLLGAIDGVMLQWVFDERAVRIERCAREIVEMFWRYSSAGRTRRL